MKNDVSAYLENIALILIAIFFLSFPLIFTTITTDPFGLPKEIILGGTTLIALLIFGSRMIADKVVRIRRTPFDLPVFLFTLAAFISALISVNRADALTSFVPLFFAAILFFLISNFVRNKGSFSFLLSSLTIGGGIASLLAILSFFKIYVLPFSFTHIRTFTPFGSLLDQALYLIVLLPLSAHFVLPYFKKKTEEKRKPLFVVSSIIIMLGFMFTVYELFAMQKPILLPLETGFQTAFAAISQDTGRVFQGLLFGSGFGTYQVDFSRFKLPDFNLNQSLWQLTFLHSSNFVLDILATTGLLGLLSFLYIIVKFIKTAKMEKSAGQNTMFISMALLLVGSFLLPFSFTIQTLLFIILGLFAASQAIRGHSDEFYDVALNLVAFKDGIVNLLPANIDDSDKKTRKYDSGQRALLPILFFFFLLSLIGFTSYFAIPYVLADTIFQKSLTAVASNNGLKVYNDQTNAIRIFRYRDAFYRTYSQVNLALANSLAASQPKDTKPNQQAVQNINTLIQQSINAARSAAVIAPETAANWQNLSSVYRGLIGFGQNADTFAIAAGQQAILLDPNNPQEYLVLGGIYYQLGQWDNAERQFQVAINLNPQFANGYYNLGHALEQKGDLQNALRQYQAVRTLLTNANDTVNIKKIDVEIAALQKKINEQTTNTTAATTTTGNPSKSPIGISAPATQLPQQTNPVKIPPPPTASGSGKITR